MAKTKVTLRVGGTLAQAAARVAETWKRAERGARTIPQDNVTFVSWPALAAVMTEKRHALLRHLLHHPAPGVRPLARALDRDYKRVHDDVQALLAAGLIERDGRILRTRQAEITATIDLRKAAA